MSRALNKTLGRLLSKRLRRALSRLLSITLSKPLSIYIFLFHSEKFYKGKDNEVENRVAQTTYTILSK